MKPEDALMGIFPVGKKVMAVKHARGRLICPECRSDVIEGVSGTESFHAGEYCDNRRTYYYCPTCEREVEPINTDPPEDEDLNVPF